MSLIIWKSGSDYSKLVKRDRASRKECPGVVFNKRLPSGSTKVMSFRLAWA